jgi:hypothetical protein
MCGRGIQGVEALEDLRLATTCSAIWSTLNGGKWEFYDVEYRTCDMETKE